VEREDLALVTGHDVREDAGEGAVLVLCDQRGMVQRVLDTSQARHPGGIPLGEKAMKGGAVRLGGLADAPST
jgi:hypothetical protein